MNFLQLLLKFLPLALQVVQAVEAALPGHTGATKKIVAFESISAALDGAPVSMMDRKAIGAAIDASVSGFNKASVFQKEKPDQVPISERGK